MSNAQNSAPRDVVTFDAHGGFELAHAGVLAVACGGTSNVSCGPSLENLGCITNTVCVDTTCGDLPGINATCPNTVCNDGAGLANGSC